MPEVFRRTLPVATVGAYLVRPSERQGPAPVLVGFHGYGESAEACLASLQTIPGSLSYTVVAVEALHRFYDRTHSRVVGSWMTKVDREQAIACNVRYVAAVVAAATAEIPSDGRVVTLGFSQGASMAYRAAAHSPGPVRGVVALGGDVPPELADGPRAGLPPVLIGRGLRDDWYTEEKLGIDLQRLDGRGVVPEVVRFEGGHEWTDAFRDAAGAFLARVAPPG
jgi:predicted esterase